MSIRRNRLESRYNSLYREIDNDGLCTYCGSRATCWDHFVPLSITHALSACGVRLSGKVLVQSCSECNLIAGTHVFGSIAQKRAFIQRALKDKYWRLYDMPAWSQEELDELGYNLKLYVTQGQEEKKWLIQRLRWRNQNNPAFAEIAGVRSKSSGGTKFSVAAPAVCEETQRPTSQSDSTDTTNSWRKPENPKKNGLNFRGSWKELQALKYNCEYCGTEFRPKNEYHRFCTGQCCMRFSQKFNHRDAKIYEQYAARLGMG